MKIKGRLEAVLLVFTIAKIEANKEPELPLCPANMAFFPQNLPMHCRMPPGGYPAVPAPQQSQQMPSEFYQSPSPDKVASPIPFPVPPGIPFPPGFPGLPPGMIGPGPVPMPMPVPAPGPAHKLPVIVMPFYSPDTSYKQRKPSHIQHQSSHRHNEKSNRYLDSFRRSHSYDSDTPSWELDKKIEYSRRSYAGDPRERIIKSPGRQSAYDTDASSDRDTSSEGSWKDHRELRRGGRRKNRKHKSKRRRYPKKDLLTPIIQYVTKDGYVIFEKKITKDEAKDWLSMKKKEVQKTERPEEEQLENADLDNKNDDNSEPNEIDKNEDVEILDGNKEKSKEKVEFQTQRAPKRQYSHKMRSHHTKEEKQKVPSKVK